MGSLTGKGSGEVGRSKMVPSIDNSSAEPRSHLRDLPVATKAVAPRTLAAEPTSTSELNEMIEGEIIPRLLMVHSAGARAERIARNSTISDAEAERFALMPLTADTAEMMAEVDALLVRGVSVESIFLDLLAPSARKLGKCWDDDLCDFVDVTLGLTRLHEVLREVALRAPCVVTRFTCPRSALFSPMPGDQHNFGSLMLEEIFNRAGWITDALIAPTQKSMLDRIAREHVDLIGLTLSNDSTSGAVSELISAIRGVSANPHIKVLVGGRMVNANPVFAAEAGADGTAEDGKSALILADQMVLDARSIVASAA